MDILASGKPVSAAALAAFCSAHARIIDQVVERSLEQPEQVAQHGEDAERVIRSGLQFTTQMLEAALAMGQVALLEDQLTWAMDRLPHDGVAPEHVRARLCFFRQAVDECLAAEHAREITPYIDWMTQRMDELTQ